MRRLGRGWKPHQGRQPSTLLRNDPQYAVGDVDVRGWLGRVEVERAAKEQIGKLSQMSSVIRYPIAVMPDLHFGNGTTVGTVIPISQAVIPSAVGVDIGCGMLAVETTLTEKDLPGQLAELRLNIEAAVPHGRTHNGRDTVDAGCWRNSIPDDVAQVWKAELEPRFKKLCVMRPDIERSNHINHLGTLGTGNHFIEVCLDERGHVWVMLHSGSRGVGSRIGGIFIELAKQEMRNLISTLPDQDLAYLKEGTKGFDEYVFAVGWAQDYARLNRELMAKKVIEALRTTPSIPPFSIVGSAVNCHHNYVEQCVLSGKDTVWLTRKGATSAKLGELAVIPGSMGAKSYIVRGKGNAESYCSCSHGAGRKYSRGEAVRRFTLEDHERSTMGVECRKDADVLDETPLAYKDIDLVMEAQEDLVEIVHTLKQVVCVKG